MEITIDAAALLRLMRGSTIAIPGGVGNEPSATVRLTEVGVVEIMHATTQAVLFWTGNADVERWSRDPDDDLPPHG